MDKVSVSIVTPVYQGASYLPELVSELARVRSEWEASGLPLELAEAIFVDDDSIDASRDVLEQCQREHSWVKVRHLSRNFGQHSATAAGIMETTGDWVATIDEDLQHHPQYLIRLLAEAVAHGYDVVYANPEGSVHGSAFRDLSSRAFKKLLARLSGNPYVEWFSSFRMMRGETARAAASVAMHSTYFDVTLCWFTQRIGRCIVPMEDRRNAAGGVSGYDLRSLLDHARRLLISSEIKVLRLATLVGGATLIVSLLAWVVTFGRKLIFHQSIPVKGWTSLILVTLFFGGVGCLLLGIIAEYLSVLVLRAQGRPAFLSVDRSKDRLLESLGDSRGGAH